MDDIMSSTFMRKVLLRFGLLQEEESYYNMVLGLDQDGNVIHNFQDPEASAYINITSVHQVGNTLYLGSLKSDFIGKYKWR